MPTPSASQLALLRMQIADTGTPPVFSDTEIGDLWSFAADMYSDDAQIFIQTKVYIYDALLSDAAKRVNYKQNQSSENLSDIFGHLLALRKLAKDDLAEASSSLISPVRLGTTRKARPTRKKDVPSA